MSYGVIVKNRFTDKVYEEHENVGINFVYQTQDAYLFKFWAKVIVYEELEE